MRREGPGAAIRHGVELVRDWIYLREEHVWYQLDLTSERASKPLPKDLRLVRATAVQVDRVGELGQDGAEARRRRERGNDAWFALDGDTLLFCCWTFRDRTPVLAAPGGELELPGGVACLEDSISSPKARGRGIAPASWSCIADELDGQGFHAMITKVTVDNVPSRKAVLKAGFREIGTMRLSRLVGRKRASMDPEGPGLGEELAALIAPEGSRPT